MRRGGGPGLLGLIYLVIGIAIAADQRYFSNVDELGRIISAVLAVFLWPLVLLGIDLRI